MSGWNTKLIRRANHLADVLKFLLNVDPDSTSRVMIALDVLDRENDALRGIDISEIKEQR